MSKQRDGGIELKPVGSHETNPFPKTQEEIDNNYHLIADHVLKFLNEYTDHIEWEITHTHHLDWWYVVSVQAKIGDFFEKGASVTFDLSKELQTSKEAESIIDHVICGLKSNLWSQAYKDMLIKRWEKRSE